MLLGAGAYVLWGLLALYWPLLEPASAPEVLAHRFVWSLVFVAGLLALRRGAGPLAALLRRPRSLALLATAALIIALNWLTYTWGVMNGHVVETSLGYFINPLVTVLLGVVVLGERLNAAQWVAIGIATVAVAGLTIDYGRLPWIALTLASTFAAYGLVKKMARVGVVEGLTVETAVLFLPALAFLMASKAHGTLVFGHAGAGHAVLAAMSGVATAVPLLLFAAAVSRIPLTMIGLLQYLAPTLQFLIGVAVFREPLPPTRLAGFALVWVALAVFTIDGIRRHRRALRLAVDAVG
jgi:chloramphenicol-sensitive protein RarD